MQNALRSSLVIAAAALAISTFSSCATHDRHIYTTHKDKNLHTPDPWAPSPTKAADEATAGMGVSPEPASASDSTPPNTDTPPPAQ